MKQVLKIRATWTRFKSNMEMRNPLPLMSKGEEEKAIEERVLKGK